MTEQALADAILKHSLQILRLSAGEQAEVEKVLRELERELKLLIESGDLTAGGKRQIEALIVEANKAIEVGYLRAGAATDTHTLAIIVAEKTQEIIQDVLPATVRLPTAATLLSLAKDVLIDGAPSSAWWAKQGDDLAFRFAAQARQGVVNGETQAQIVARIVGKRGEPGIMDVTRRNARVLVHSSVMTAANQARLATFQKNARLIKGVRWLATLDGHVCFTAETLVTMADGTARCIAEIRAGDVVTGGVTGEPCRVLYAGKRVAPSTVVIHKDGVAIGASTDDHPVLTPNGWREIGSVALSADVFEREVLCRSDQASECQVQGAQEERRNGQAVRAQSGLAQARRAGDDNHWKGDELRNGLRNGDCADRASEHESAGRLQYDERRRFIGRSDPGRSVAGEDFGEQPQTGAITGSAGCCQQSNCGEMVRPGISRAGEFSSGSQASRVAEQPRMESQGCCEEGRGHAAQVARSNVSGKNGGSQSSGHDPRDARAGCCVPFGEYDAGSAFGGGQEVLGYPEAVSVASIVGYFSDEPADVYTLTIEGDPTFIAGGMIVHNCARCAALDGQAWNLDGEKLPGTRMGFMAPPIHWGDRCVLSPIPKTFREIGLNIDEPTDEGQRASAQGPVPGKTTFDEFFARQSKAQQDAQFGPVRAGMFRAGKITVKDLVSGTGRELTLNQLR